MTNSVRDRVQRELEEIGLTDVQLPENSLNYETVKDIPYSQVNFGTVEVDCYKPLPPDQNHIIDTTQTLDIDGLQFQLNISGRPVCGNCGKAPHEEHEARRPVECAECDTTVCSCAAYCHTCDKALCYDCRTGYSDDGLVLCKEHKQERVDDVRFQREFQVWKEKLASKIQLVQEKKEFYRIKVDKQKQRMKIKKEKAVRLAEVQRKRRKDELELEKKQLEESRKRMAETLQAEVKRRKQRLELFKSKVQAQLDQREQDVNAYKAATERRKAENQFQVDMREQDIKEMEQRLDHTMKKLEWAKEMKKQDHESRMDEAELAFKKREKLVEIADKMRQMKWDEANDFLDLQGRLQNDGFERLNPERKSGRNDGKTIVLDPDDDDQPQVIEEDGSTGVGPSDSPL